ncbi:hypothetical protein AVU39_gp58 [Sulfolobus monocaudavirus SMV2]|uniref:hypothetical protein n=1 Tax=Sulfolobus monocaudavirus SMV2 TaxID=1580591 RepID=UPI0006D310C0|nr:hypothetical protein AVU39_gp58 [Sulfolobus monocaudavirus SMV2]AIZ11392.1 hypothetical protein [Sulfolobus monocaudavirus SMV2]
MEFQQSSNEASSPSIPKSPDVIQYKIKQYGKLYREAQGEENRHFAYCKYENSFID